MMLIGVAVSALMLAIPEKVAVSDVSDWAMYTDE
jgi:hypothetical protein